jgi:hypothetical protein
LPGIGSCRGVYKRRSIPTSSAGIPATEHDGTNHRQAAGGKQALNLRVFLEGVEVGKRQALAKLLQPLGRDRTVVDQFGVTLEDGFGKQLAARDLDGKRTLEAKGNVEEINRLGPQITLQGGRGFDTSSSTFNASTSAVDTF